MPRQLIRRLVFSTPLILLLASPIWSQQGQQKPDTAARWKAKVLNVTSPSQVPIVRRSQFGGTLPAAAEAAPAGSRWVVINIELTAPNVGASLEPQAIRIIDKASGVHAALALSSTPESGKAPDYLYFKDSEGLGLINKEGKLLWMFGYGKLSFQTTSPQKVSLLFSPPSATKPASLVVGDSEAVVLTLAK